MTTKKKLPGDCRKFFTLLMLLALGGQASAREVVLWQGGRPVADYAGRVQSLRGGETLIFGDSCPPVKVRSRINRGLPFVRHPQANLDMGSNTAVFEVGEMQALRLPKTAPVDPFEFIGDARESAGLSEERRVPRPHLERRRMIHQHAAHHINQFAALGFQLEQLGVQSTRVFMDCAPRFVLVERLHLQFLASHLMSPDFLQNFSAAELQNLEQALSDFAESTWRIESMNGFDLTALGFEQGASGQYRLVLFDFNGPMTRATADSEQTLFSNYLYGPASELFLRAHTTILQERGLRSPCEFILR